MNAATLNDIDLARFNRDGFITIKSLASRDICAQIRSTAEQHLAEQWAPVEYEADVQYPGSPKSTSSPGGNTVRRLLQAYSRHPGFRHWGTSDNIKLILQQLFQAGEVLLSQCHHNCIMTKQPGCSSATLWHQDNRFWSFDEQNLISVWLALGDETRANGCLRVIPGTHRMTFEPGRFNAALFLRSDLEENKQLIAKAERVELGAGDVIFFHSRLFHAASRNLTDRVKYSLVYTYHIDTNKPIFETRSARFPSIPLQ